jgi:hypothetical protein
LRISTSRTPSGIADAIIATNWLTFLKHPPLGMAGRAANRRQPYQLPEAAPAVAGPECHPEVLHEASPGFGEPHWV